MRDSKCIYYEQLATTNTTTWQYERYCCYQPYVEISDYLNLCDYPLLYSKNRRNINLHEKTSETSWNIWEHKYYIFSLNLLNEIVGFIRNAHFYNIQNKILWTINYFKKDQNIKKIWQLKKFSKINTLVRLCLIVRALY